MFIACTWHSVHVRMQSNNLLNIISCTHTVSLSWMLNDTTWALLIYISRWCGNVCLNDDSNPRRHPLNASRVNLNRVDVHGGQSARDDKSHRRTPRAEHAWRFMAVLRHSVCIETAWQTLPGLSLIGKNMIGLASRFGYIIVKCRPIGVYGDLDHSALGRFAPSSFVI